MMYFNDDELKVLREMIDYCDAYDENDVPRAYSELLGVIRFKVQSECKYKSRDIEDGVPE